jgi:formylglycine-generating enzyme required for sulfatase activity
LREVSMLVLDADELMLEGEELHCQRSGELDAVVRTHLLAEGSGGLVVLGSFGSGKTQLCSRFSAHDDPDVPPCTVVPLAVLGRSTDLAAGLERIVGRTRLEEARDGRRVLFLDGLDEVAEPGPGSYDAFFQTLVPLVGPRWVLTSRPSHFRTSLERDPDQADSLALPGVRTIFIRPLDNQTVCRSVGALPNGRALLRSVAGLIDLASSPLLLQIAHAAAPYIEPGRPIDAWGLFDAWLRYALSSGPFHGEVLAHLETLAWRAFRDSGFSTETMSFPREMLSDGQIPASLRRTLMVTDLDGRVRFGHRSVFEYFLAAHLTPRIAANQGQGPDELSGLRITDATRAFLVGRVPRMPVRYEGDRVRIPRGNFIAGGSLNPDERPLRIQHLAEPAWIARVPVTGADWADWLRERPDHRQDALYLRHWGPERTLPPGHDSLPIFHLWPTDADAYAAAHGARLPTADEWEKAARGIDGRIWPWGDHWRPGLAGTAELGIKAPLPVRALGAQGHAGLFSAIGGVFEYTSSHWRGREDRGRIVMGGCYTHPNTAARSGLRLSHKLSGNLKAGLRLAWDAT